MILSSQHEIAAHLAEGIWGHPTLDELFSMTARKAPERVALIDPPNRGTFTDGAPRQLTFAQTAAAAEALAARFESLGLAEDDIVAVQLPNSVEAYVVLLALFRARLIACPVPTLWREHDLHLALSQVAPRALVTATRIDGHAHGEMMRIVAGEQHSVRHVLAFGTAPPDGVVPLGSAPEGVPGAASRDRLRARRAQAADHVAIVCFETDGGAAPRPVARSHNQLIAAALHHIAAADIAGDDVILNPYFPTGLLALAAAFGPWVLTGATLALHHPLDTSVLARSLIDFRASHAILPPRLIAALVAGVALSPARTALRRLGCAWPAAYLARANGQAAASGASGLPVVDLYSFGETATLALRRGKGAVPGRIPLGRIGLGADGKAGPAVLETRVRGGLQKAAGATALSGTLQVRGAMTPSAYPGAEPESDGGGFLATGVRAQIAISDPPSADCFERERDVIHVGHGALSAAELDGLLLGHSGVRDAAIYAVPDRLTGERVEAAIVAVEGANVSSGDVRAYFLSRKVAEHKIPRRTRTVAVIPRDAAGRVARHELAREG